MNKYPDPIDKAAEYEAENLRLALVAQRASRQPSLAACGRCYNCGEVLTVGLFCPPLEQGQHSECRVDWETRRRLKGRKIC